MTWNAAADLDSIRRYGGTKPEPYPVWTVGDSEKLACHSIDMAATVSNLSRYIMETQERVIIRNFAKVDPKGLLRLRNVIDQALCEWAGVKEENR